MVDAHMIGFIGIVVIIVIGIVIAYASRKKENLETLYMPEPQVIYPGHGKHHKEHDDKEGGGEPCCGNDSDMLTLMIIALMNKTMNKNTKAANANCVQRVVKHTIPQVMMRLGAYGIDMNNINYGNPSIVNTVSSIIINIIQEAMRDPDMCAEEPYPPAQCPTSIIDVDVPACNTCDTPTKPPTTTIKPPTTTIKPPTTTIKPPTTTIKPTSTTIKPTSTPTRIVANVVQGTFFIVSAARLGKCEQFLTAASCSATPKVDAPVLKLPRSRNAVWMIKKLADKTILLVANGREGTNCSNILSTTPCTGATNLSFSTKSTEAEEWLIEPVPQKVNRYYIRSVIRSPTTLTNPCKNYLSAQNCPSSPNVELNLLDKNTLNQEWLLEAASRDVLYEGDCLYSGESLYKVTDDALQTVTSKVTLTEDGDVVLTDLVMKKEWSLRKSAEHTQDDLIGKANGPFKLCLDKSGELTLYNVKGTKVWRSDTLDKANGPFMFRLKKDKADQMAECFIFGYFGMSNTPTNTLMIWHNDWLRSCEAVKKWYPTFYKEVKEADSWKNYKAAVLDKKGEQKEGKIWAGPKCDTCANTIAWYNDLYPDVVKAKKDPVRHYFEVGAKENRIWKGMGANDACIILPELKGEILLGISMNNTMWTKKNFREPWVLVPTHNCCVKSIVVMSQGWILGVGMDNRLHGKLSLAGAWKNLTDATGIIDIFEIGGVLYGIKTDNKIYKKDPFYAPWKLYNNVGATIAVDKLRDNKIMAVGTNNEMFMKDNIEPGKWTGIATGGNVKVIDFVELKNGAIIGVGMDNRLYFAENRNKFSWKQAWVADNSGTVRRIETIPVPHTAKPFPNRDVLYEGECLKSGEELVSGNGRFKLKFGADGHLDIYDNNNRTWGAGRNGEHSRLALPWKAPFKICLKPDGNLVQTDANYKGVFGTEVWQLYTGGKDNGPFRMIMQDNGNLIIAGSRQLVWANIWYRSCEGTRQHYLGTYKDIKGVDPWDHYRINVLEKAPGSKQSRMWPGPKCGSCKDAVDRYRWLYPDVKTDIIRHYSTYGAKENRIWLAKGGKDACMPITQAPTAPPNKDTLNGGECLVSGKELVSKNGVYKVKLEKNGHFVIYKNGVKDWSAGEVVNKKAPEHTRLGNITFKQPYKMCMQKDGNLVEYDSANAVVYATDTNKKAAGPFRLTMQDDGNLVVYGNQSSGLPIWAAKTFYRSCEGAREKYLRMYEDIRKANRDPWDHYREMVLDKPASQKEQRLWVGPKCGSCEEAAKSYNTSYPDVKKAGIAPSRHYFTHGNSEQRLWRAKGGKDACIPTTKPPPPPTTKPPPPSTQPPPPAVLPKCDRNNTNNIKYSNPKTNSEGKMRFEGLKKGVRCLYPVDGTAIPTQDELYIHFDDEGGGSGGGGSGGGGGGGGGGGSGTIEEYQQCGGKGGECAAKGTCVDSLWPGKSCKSGTSCRRQSEWYHQCL